MHVHIAKNSGDTRPKTKKSAQIANPTMSIFASNPEIITVNPTITAQTGTILQK